MLIAKSWWLSKSDFTKTCFLSPYEHLFVEPLRTLFVESTRELIQCSICKQFFYRYIPCGDDCKMKGLGIQNKYYKCRPKTSSKHMNLKQSVSLQNAVLKVGMDELNNKYCTMAIHTKQRSEKNLQDPKNNCPLTTLQGSPHEDPWWNELHVCRTIGPKSKNICTMLALVRPRVRSKLVIHDNTL